MQSLDRFVRLTDKPRFPYDSSFSQNEEQNDDVDSNETSKQSKSPNAKETKPEPILPAFVRQIYMSRVAGHLTIFGLPTRLVAILGVLTRIDRLDNQLVYHVRDDTGSIRCYKWLEDGIYQPDIGIYIKVQGVMQIKNHEPSILIVNCSPMKSLNELTCHMLEVLYVAIARNKKREQSQRELELSIQDDR